MCKVKECGVLTCRWAYCWIVSPGPGPVFSCPPCARAHCATPSKDRQMNLYIVAESNSYYYFVESTSHHASHVTQDLTGYRQEDGRYFHGVSFESCIGRRNACFQSFAWNQSTQSIHSHLCVRDCQLDYQTSFFTNSTNFAFSLRILRLVAVILGTSLMAPVYFFSMLLVPLVFSNVLWCNDLQWPDYESGHCVHECWLITS